MSKHFNKLEFHQRLEVLIGQQNPLSWAKQLGISKQEFNKIWKDGYTTSLENLILIHRNTGVSLDWLIIGGEQVAENEKIPLSNSMRENGDDLIKDVYCKSRSICWQDDSDNNIVLATEDELSRLTDSLREIFVNYLHRQTYKGEEQFEYVEDTNKRNEASRQAEEEAVKNHNRALKSAEVDAVNQRREASARAKTDAIDRHRSAMKLAKRK